MKVTKQKNTTTTWIVPLNSGDIVIEMYRTVPTTNPLPAILIRTNPDCVVNIPEIALPALIRVLDEIVNPYPTEE